MKKSIIKSILAALIVLMGALVSSCGPTKAEKEAIAKADSILRADSIAKVEMAKLEAVRQDSIAKAETIRQDSIARIEEFQAKIPSFSRIFKYNTNIGRDELHNYLISLGFTRSKKGEVDEYNEYNEEVITYKLSLDSSHYCVIEHARGYEWGETRFTIVGAPEQLEKAKSEALKLKPSWERGYGANPYMEIKGNTILWGDGA